MAAHSFAQSTSTRGRLTRAVDGCRLRRGLIGEDARVDRVWSADVRSRGSQTYGSIGE
jgi:hypothetical protein